MPDKIMTEDARRDHSTNWVLIGVALAALVAILILFGARLGSDETSLDTGAAPPATEAPATGGNPPAPGGAPAPQ